MATKVHMEALSPTMEEGQLVKWMKAEGDPVSNGDVLAEIETDKATMELVARGEGVLRKVFLQEGETAPVGEVIALIAGEDEEIEGLAEGQGKTEEREDSGEPESGGEEGSEEAEDAGDAEDAGEAEDARDGKDAGDGEGEESGEAEMDQGHASMGGGAKRIKASPLARRMAGEADLDLSRIPGSGPGGRVVVRDVEAALAETKTGEAPAAPDRREGEDFQDHPLSQMRKTIAKRLVESISPVPHFFLRISVDMSRVLAARERVNKLLEPDDEKVSINDFILKAVAGALARHPEVNAEWRGDAIRRHHRVHLGVAVAVEDGLITPVIRDADRKGLATLSREVRELAARGREKKLKPDEYSGSTFSVSNLGMYGIEEFTGVINPPEGGILAVGGVQDVPVVREGEVVVEPRMQVTMSCDHRVVDGATGARFLQTLKEMLEEPAAILV